MADRAIVNRNVAAAPKDYQVAAGISLDLKAVRAVIDGSGAAGAFLPTLQLIAPDGTVMWESAPPTSTAAGGSADVSWFPGVGEPVSGTAVSFGGARIYASAAQTIPNNTATDITFNAVDVDTLGMANLAANNRILTATFPGFYLVNGQIQYLANQSGLRNLHLTLNGYYSASTGTNIGIQTYTIVANSTQPVTATGLVYMNAGDFVSLGTLQTSGGSLTTAGVGPELVYSHLLSAVLVGV